MDGAASPGLTKMIKFSAMMLVSGSQNSDRFGQTSYRTPFYPSPSSTLSAVFYLSPASSPPQSPPAEGIFPSWVLEHSIP